MDTQAKAQAPPVDPLARPLHPAHPEVEAKPVLVADLLTGSPTWVYPPQPVPTSAPRVDPMAQRILAAGAVAPLIGWGGNMLFGAIAGATTGIGYLALCLIAAAALRAGSGRQGAVNIRIDNRGR